MKFRPLHDRVVVRRIEEDMKTTGGIIIPDTAKEKPMQGKVIAVGPGARDDCGKLVPLDVKKGDRVLFGNPLTRRSVARASWGFTFWSDDSPATSR
jgi:chaperonin GroES